MRFLLSSLLSVVLLLAAWASAEAAPVRWEFLEQDQILVLSQDLQLGEARFEREAVFSVEEITSLDMIGVREFILKKKSCSTPDLKAEMILVLPESASSGSEVGVELRPACRLAIYAEVKDLDEPSFFSAD